MSPAKRVTIREVAEAAGVSLTTVSHALSGKGRVDERTRDHVRSVADALGFVPSRVARGLATGRTATIGLALPDLAGVPTDEVLDSDWYGRVIVSAARQALHHEYAVTILPPFATLAELRRYSLDGVIVLEAGRNDRRLAVLASAQLPHVSTDGDPEHPTVPHVSADVQTGFRSLLDHLREQGASNVLLLAPPVQLGFFTEAIAIADAAAGPEFTTRHEVVGASENLSREGLFATVREATRAALAAAEPPDAIVGMFEGFGANIIAAAEESGISVPGQLLVAQDIDGISAQITPPGITALDQHADLQARAAVDLVVALIAGEPSVAHLVTPATLRTRGSSSRTQHSAST